VRCESERFAHTQDRKNLSVGERHVYTADFTVAAEGIERDSGERGTHFEAMEPGLNGGLLAVVEDKGAEPAPGEAGMDEDGTDFRGIYIRVEREGDAMGAVVASEEGVAKAPAAAAGEGFGFVCRLGDEVGLVGDQLGIEAECVAERAFNLRGIVVVLLQLADG